MKGSYKGLSEEDVNAKREEFGSNMLPQKPPPSDLRILLSQLQSPLVYILLAAGIVTYMLGHISDTIIIAIAVFINTILGYIQEERAGKALYALKQLIHPTTTVIRDGKQMKIPVEDLVPEDIVILHQGDKIPSDGILLEANRFFAMEAMLTGESVPVSKQKDDEIYMGTIVQSGVGVMQVVKIGSGTKIGAIALSVQEGSEETPLTRQMKVFSRELTLLVLVLVAIVIIVGFIDPSRDFADIFTTAVALAVSAIPEGLLVGLTVVLAIGMQRLLKRKGLVRNLVSAETLGGVSVICTDKTGTLTKGQMKVLSVKGNENELIEQALVANDLDDPVVVAAYDWAKSKYNSSDKLQSYLEKKKRIDSIPFNSSDRFFASLNKYNTRSNKLYVNGAVEYLLQWSDITEAEKKKIQAEVDELTIRGQRIIGFAKKRVDRKKKKLSQKDVKKKLEWVGILGFEDPVRSGVKVALERTKRAGIFTIVITGDYAQTAKQVMLNLGMSVSEESTILGEELNQMNSTELSRRIKEDKINLFARTTPDQKLKIVESLKKNGEVVAMMGDGVNDAPALNQADIGVVVGDATDVAKETADLVLLDSSFSTIVAAVEEGRAIFANIRKIILYLMSDAFSEIVAVLATLVLGLSLPVTAVQILWINLVSDGLPHLALTVDPTSKDLMNLPPRKAQEKLVTSWMRYLIATVSIIGGVIALILFIYYLKTTGDLVIAQSVAFATLGMNSLVYVFSVRTLTKPFWKENMFGNKWLIAAVMGGMVLQILPYYVELGNRFLGIKPLGLFDWGVIFASSIIVFIFIELAKMFSGGLWR